MTDWEKHLKDFGYIGRYEPKRISGNLWMVWDTWCDEASSIVCFGTYPTQESCKGAIKLLEFYKALMEEKRLRRHNQWTYEN